MTTSDMNNDGHIRVGMTRSNPKKNYKLYIFISVTYIKILILSVKMCIRGFLEILCRKKGEVP
ncbi:hypothetical protein AGR4B_Cc60770 [Agrobacterium tumefaciens str. CFBP 5621]|nr:hypothetical protein AGR4B_Cc60770 [Agrobacterium tumefaciens str. CFBP 5621]